MFRLLFFLVQTSDQPNPKILLNLCVSLRLVNNWAFLRGVSAGAFRTKATSIHIGYLFYTFAQSLKFLMALYAEFPSLPYPLPGCEKRLCL